MPIKKLVSASLMALLAVVPFSFEAQAKRLPPPEIKPISREGLQYSYTVTKIVEDCPDKDVGCGDRIFVTAQSGEKEKWRTEIYQVVYDAKLEHDVQQIFPKSLRFKEKSGLEVIDERGKRYVVNRVTGARVSPKTIFVYSGP